MNQCNFIGRLTADPDTKFTTSGKQVTRFDIAVSKKVKGEDKPEFIKIVCWEKIAEIATNYLTKGNRVRITGEYTTQKWQDQQGNNRYTVEIVAREIELLTPKEGSGNVKPSDYSGVDRAFQQGAGDTDEDTVPF